MWDYNILKEDRRRYASLIILNEIINNQKCWSIILENEDKYLEELFTGMLSDEWVKIDNEKYVYVPTKKGEDILIDVYQRLKEYLSIYDIYSAVDVENGEFAFDKYWEMSQDEFSDYLNNERWMDLRIAVCQFKKINPIEIVFLSFLNDNVFDIDKDGWQFDLYSDLIWDEIINICKTAYSMEEFGGECAMIDLLTKGNEVMKKLFEQEEEMDEYEGNYTDDSHITHYYSNPTYVSPFWLKPIF